MKKVVSVLFITVVTMLLVVGWRWYAYVTNTEKPYDEVGIELNIRMPGPLNAWGCKRLHDTSATFPRRMAASHRRARWCGKSMNRRLLAAFPPRDIRSTIDVEGRRRRRARVVRIRPLTASSCAFPFSVIS
ncbi:hypothetical protein AB7M37_005789 [Sinorhizobium fredii]